MIPWFVVRFLRMIVQPFGRHVVATSTIGRRGVDRIFIVRADRIADARLAGITSARADDCTSRPIGRPVRKG